jgi:hypothetical protein
MGVYNGTIGKQITESGLADAATGTAPVPGCAVVATGAAIDGIQATFGGDTAGNVFGFGVAMGVDISKLPANQPTYATGNPIMVATGGDVLVLLSSAVTDVKIPLVGTVSSSVPTGFAPASPGQHAMLLPCETGAANTYIRAKFAYMTY